MIEQATYDLPATQPVARKVVPFAQADDARWAGVVELASGDILQTHGNERTDVFLLQGAIISASANALRTGRPRGRAAADPPSW